jgi:Ca2+-binding RTX toxin-like protein
VIDMGRAEFNRFGQDIVDARGLEKGIYFNMGSGAVVALDQSTGTNSSLGWLWKLGGVLLSENDLVIKGANAVYGTDYSDILISNGGKAADGEGYSEVHGGGGNDLLIGRGHVSHLFGGEGKDRFEIGANTWIEDAQSHDSISYGGIVIPGGVKQWWMEGNTAYWAPFSTVIGAFPVVGSAILFTASFFIDVMTMKFASFRRDGAGNLQLNLGWGHGGVGAIKDYNLNLDTGEASAGVVVFEQVMASDFSLDKLRNYVNLALKAGFGIGLNGWDPLVLDLDGDGLELSTEGNSRVYFEFDGDGFGERTGWVRPDDGFLVRDANANGIIDDATELFGNQSTSGFAMLGAFDLNADGRIDGGDAVYGELRVWRDADQDGVTDAGELKTLAELGIASISLAAAAPAQPTAIGGNQIVRTGQFTRADGTTGSIADIAFAISETASKWLGDSTISASAAALPQLRGFGEVKDLRVAMTGDAALEAMVSSYASGTSNDLAVLKSGAEAILFKWAGVDAVAAVAIGSNGFDARKLAFLEKYSGYALMPRTEDGTVDPANVGEMERMWSDTVNRLTLRLVVQGPMADEFEGIQYRADIDLLVADNGGALANLYARVLATLPADPAAALAVWQGWAPLLGVLAEGMRRFDANVVRDDYAAAQLLSAMDRVAQPLGFAELAGTLGFQNLRLGTAGDDALARGGASGTAVYVATGGGTDTLTGGGGQDVYIFGRQIGQAVIDDNEARAGGDRIRFAFHNPGDVKLERSGNDLLITVKATGETVRVLGQFAPVVPISSDVLLSSNKGVEDIQFADGTVYEIPEIMTAVGTGTDGDDHLVGTMHSDVLIGGLGNDRLEGGDDADLYVVRAGDGHDVIHDSQTNPLLRAADLLIFGSGLTPDQLVFSRAGSGGDDLLVTVGNSGQSILVEGQFGYSSLGYHGKFALNTRIESFAFRDVGDNFGYKELQQRLIAGSTTAAADVTLGFGDDDLFEASAGNDLLIGLDGADIYRWGMGAGNDIIDERSRFIDIVVDVGGISSSVEPDMVEFGAGIVRSSVKFSRPSAAPDLLVTILATGESLLVKNQFDGFMTGTIFGAQWFDRIEYFRFADGLTISWKDVLSEVTTGGAGNDSLWGELNPDRMDGGLGNDFLSGKGMHDTYIFNIGYGHDTLADDNHDILGAGFISLDTNPDVLKFGAGIAPSDIRFERSGKDLILVVGTNGDKVTLAGQDDYFHTGVFGALNWNRIEEVHFDDGTIWTWQELNRRVIALSTTDGDDQAVGFMMEDRFEASAGDDIMEGGDSADTYVFGFGSGDDIIREGVSNVLYDDQDILEFGPGVTPSDVSIARDGEDLLITLSSGDTATIDGEFAYSNWFQWWDVNLFRFADGTEWTKHDIQVRLLQSTAGDDHLYGFMTGDVLDGGAGNDLLEGGDGADTYVFGYGSGDDIIKEWLTNANLSDEDRVVLGPGVTAADVGLARDGDDLVVTLISTGETLRILGQFSFSNWFAWWDVERFEFADGTVWTDRDVANKIMGGTPGNDHIVGTFRGDTLDGGLGNDILEGGDGADRYVFGRGYGRDEIRESLSNANLSEDDQLEFLPGIVLSDLKFERQGNNLLVSILGTQDSILIKDEFAFSNWYTWWDIDRFVFADGSVVTKGDVQQILLTPTAGNDHVVGFMSGDVIDGGAGNDVLEGMDGPDTYLFGRGSGSDVIKETLTNANLSDDDRLVFGPGVLPSDIGLARQGDDLVITILGTTDTLRIQGQFSFSNWFSWWDIERFEFADGTVWTDREVSAKLTGGTPGDDHIIGTFRGDLLDGGGGKDILEGGDGADRYVFGRGYGHDEIRENLSNANLSEDDQLQFLPGITLADLGFTRQGENLLITIAGTDDRMLIKGQFSYSNWFTWWDVDSFVFADGSMLTRSMCRTSCSRRPRRTATTISTAS